MSDNDSLTPNQDINDLEPPEIRKLLNKKIGSTFYSCGWAFLGVQNENFIDLVQTLLKIRPDKLDYEPPSRFVLAGSVLDAVHADLDKIKKIYLENTDGTLMNDGWTNSNANKKFLVSSVRNINVDQAFLTYADNTLSSEHAVKLKKCLEDAVTLAYEKYGINIVNIVTDNDSKIKAAASMVKNVHGEKLITSTCMSHSGNLLIKSLVNESLSKKARAVIKAFGDPKLALMIKIKNGHKLRNYPDTRFCFFRNTCEAILKNLNQEILQNILAEGLHVPDKVEKLVFSKKFRKELRTTIKLLKPVCQLINLCQDPDTNVADGTELWITLNLDTDAYDEIVTERVIKAVPEVGYASNYLHPKYKGLNLDDDQIAVANRFLQSRLDADGLEELNNYRHYRATGDHISRNCTDPISYWSILESKYPKLSKLCQKMFIIPASTALLEGLFSQWTWIHNKYRNSLSNRTSALLVDTHYLSKHIKNGVWVNKLNEKKKNYMEIDDNNDDDVDEDYGEDDDEDTFDEDSQAEDDNNSRDEDNEQMDLDFDVA